MTATTGVGGLIYGRALVDQKTGKKINFDELGGGNIPEDITDLIASKAPIESPSFTGNPQAPTPLDDAIGKEIANVEYVRGLIAKLADSAPETLDTLNELAKALGDDPNFATTITNALAGKQPLSEILTSLSGLITAENKLAYFSDTNVMALANLSAVGRVIIGQDSKTGVLDYLGIKTAATKDVQNDIYDATYGVVSLPGAFGFGYIFDTDKRVMLKGAGAFNDWVSNVLPGRYYVYGYDGVEVEPGNSINGIIEVIYPIAMFNDDPTKTEKILIYYGMGLRSVYIGAYTVFINGQWRGWVPVFFDDTELKTLISAKASLESPSFSGTPTAPTPSDSASGTQLANVEFVKKQISDNAYTLSAGTVTVLDSGSQPTIEITGQSPSQVLNLGIPKAPDGQTIKSVNAVVKEIDSAQQVTLTFTMTDDSSQQASFNIPFSPQPTMKTYQQSGNFSFNYSDNPNAYSAAGKFGSSIYLKTTIDLTRLPMARNDAFVTVRLLELPCTEDGTILNYNIFTESPNAPVGAYTNVPVWLVLPSIPTHTIDPKTKEIKKLVRGDGPSGLDGVIPVAGPDEPAHEFRWYLRYQFLNN